MKTNTPELITLTLWSQEPPVRDFPSPDSERDWTMTALTSASALSDWFWNASLGGSFGKTSLEFSPPEKARTLAVFSPDSQEWTYPFQSRDGRTQASSSGQTGITPSPGVAWTRSSLEYPKDGVASSLSDILETGDVPQRYFLSATACRGILRRAAKRGKALPQSLRDALEAAASEPTLTVMADSSPALEIPATV